MWVWNVDSSANGSDLVQNTLVLRDSDNNTYWNEKGFPCDGYSLDVMNEICPVTNSTFIFIGYL